MKKIFVLILILIAPALYAQTNATMNGGIYSDTLKTGAKSLFTITNDYPYSNSRITLALYTVSGYDTVTVTSASRNNAYYTPRAVIDLSTGAPVTSIVVSPVVKEYLLYDPTVFKFKISSTAHQIAPFTVSRK